VAGRAAMVLLAATTPAAAEGLGSAFRASLPAYAAPLAIAQVVLAAATDIEWRAVLVAVASVAIVRTWLVRRLDGFTGDCLGFQCVMTETAVLIALAWRR
jgi:cobalamin synthase